LAFASSILSAPVSTGARSTVADHVRHLHVDGIAGSAKTLPGSSTRITFADEPVSALTARLDLRRLLGDPAMAAISP
jgi:hypothetical protein